MKNVKVVPTGARNVRKKAPAHHPQTKPKPSSCGVVVQDSELEQQRQPTQGEWTGEEPCELDVERSFDAA
jgi:hypothetical protein